MAAEPSAHDEARAQFAAGAAAASAADYAAALEAFLAAREAGLDGPAVHYNIGVCAWSLGRLDLAESAFLETSRYPAMAALAHYNLGLVSQRRGDDSAARAWFEKALQGSRDDQAVQSLAAARLDGMSSVRPGADLADGQRERSARSRPPVAAFVTAVIGHDDNVALLADGDLLGVTDMSSAYGELQAVASVPLAGDLSLQAGAYLVSYTDLPELDQDGAQLELRFTPRAGAWRADLRAGFGLNRIDGERFEDTRSVSLGARRPLGGGWDLGLRLRYADIDGNAPYEGLGGDRTEAMLRLRHAQDTRRVRLDYRFETNEREDAAFSPDRHHIHAELRQALGRGIEGALSAGWRHSRYSPGVSSWSERRTLAGIELSGPIANGWAWVAGYDWAENSSSLPEYEYRRNRLFLGLEAVF